MRSLLASVRARLTPRVAVVGGVLLVGVVAAACSSVAASVGSTLIHDAHLSTGRRSSMGMELRAESHQRSLSSHMTTTTTTTTLPPTTVPTTTALPPSAPGLVAGRVTVVGDSVTVDAAPALQSLIPGCVVDAQVGEQWETGISSLQSLRSSGQLGAVVVVALGTNGPVSAAEFSQMMSTLSGTSRVVVVTNHAPDYWEEQNNALFRSELPHYPTLRIADWDAAARANPGWLYSDDTHMPIGGPGAEAFAALVKAQI